jgi:hypothetical protein
MRLTAQEIRCAMYHGSLIEEIKSLNDYPSWRKVFGKKHTRLKDQELILRFLALYNNAPDYQRPMAEFLNKFTSKYKDASANFRQDCRSLFTSTLDVIWSGLQRKAFRLGGALNAAVFDSAMVGLARRIHDRGPIDPHAFASAYEELLSDAEYMQAVSRSTADEAFVSLRLRKATESFTKL